MNLLSSSFSLAGRRALVTGSSRGIGAALARGLAKAGADVMVHCTDRGDAAREVSADIAALGRRTGIFQADLAAGDAPRRILDATVATLGGLDILVSNASVQFPEPWIQISREHFDQQVVVNWRSALELIQLAAPTMLERGWGRIVTIGSVQEVRPHPDMVVYAGLKAAQTLMVRNLAKQFAPRGVTINNVAPGVILTDRTNGRLGDQAYAEHMRAAIPAGCFGEPADCVGAALLLCSEAGRYITGQNLYIDGGMSL